MRIVPGTVRSHGAEGTRAYCRTRWPPHERSSMDPKADLIRLAREADEAIAVADRQRAESQLRRSPQAGALARRRAIRVGLAVLLLLPLVMLQTHFALIERLADRVFPSHALQREQTDMKTVLDSARATVESARSRLGALPDALPSAALAALVSYERRGDTYRLSMSDGHTVATMDGDGTVAFENLNQ